MGKLLTRKTMVVLLGISLLGAIAWWQHRPLLAKYYVRQLVQASEANRESWATQVIGLDTAAVSPLLGWLDIADKLQSENLECALVGLARRWGADETRSQQLLEQLSERFESWATPAKNSVLQVPIVLLIKAPGSQAPSPTVTRLAGELLTMAMKDEGLRVATLHLAAALVTSVPHGQWLDTCRNLALKGLAAPAADTRVAALELILRPPLRQENDLLTKVVPLLKDPVAQVRKTALLAVGQAPAVISDEDLLPLLHDPDDEVQNLCELALRSRGLQENHILLARYISDERPTARLRVLQLLRDTHDLEPGVWLRRLCQDPAPAVRAAAIRAAVSQSQVDLGPCLSDMALKDSSLTVRQLAAHYLHHAQVSDPRP